MRVYMPAIEKKTLKDVPLSLVLALLHIWNITFYNIYIYTSIEVKVQHDLSLLQSLHQVLNMIINKALLVIFYC